MFPASFTALFDACVLYPASLRDFLMHLNGVGLYRARWTDRIHDEWIGSLLKNEPHQSREKLERTRHLMNISVMDCLVTGYEHLIPALELPDPDDRHVLAAAIKCHADVIVTVNLKDFPREALKQHDIEPQHPDTFACHHLDLNPVAVCTAARQHRLSMKRPAKNVDEYLSSLEHTGLVTTAAAMRQYEDAL